MKSHAAEHEKYDSITKTNLNLNNRLAEIDGNRQMLVKRLGEWKSHSGLLEENLCKEKQKNERLSHNLTNVSEEKQKLQKESAANSTKLERVLHNEQQQNYSLRNSVKDLQEVIEGHIKNTAKLAGNTMRLEAKLQDERQKSEDLGKKKRLIAETKIGE